MRPTIFAADRKHTGPSAVGMGMFRMSSDSKSDDPCGHGYSA